MDLNVTQNGYMFNFLAPRRFFDQNQYPDFQEKVQIADMTGLTWWAVQVWFQNQRASAKRKMPMNHKEQV